MVVENIGLQYIGVRSGLSFKDSMNWKLYLLQVCSVVKGAGSRNREQNCYLYNLYCWHCVLHKFRWMG